ncbi:UDP-N-acetylmuramoyl-L-alanyl-D-glutamate--2,6-diaminopimelate ligase [Gordonia zhaorongruii]|uniref:UDP-N-acetylmuramoyl-L-alanyl-D-glutamate--2, 6-diaminopimelate ligase n=1 Tax=Gordonia zhaorongruii TaxID=2597659 RepID=UPI002E262A30
MNRAQERQDRPASHAVSLGELIELSGAGLDDPEGLEGVTGAGTQITGTTLRAQECAPGDLFAAMAGSRAHGAQFAVQAAQAGAVAVLTDERGLEIVRGSEGGESLPVLVHPNPRLVLGRMAARVNGDPSTQLTLIGITGTSGKTTTAYLTEAALRAAGYSVGLVGTTGSRIDGVPIHSELTTPEAPDLQRLLAVMLARGADYVVMEVSSHALSLGRVDGCRFAVGAFTNLSQDHLDYHKTMADYFDAKAALFTSGSPTRALRSVICVDDEWGAHMAAIAAGNDGPLVTVSTVSGDADEGWRVADVTASSQGVQRIEAVAPDGSRHVVRLPLPGAYNVANALVALALVTETGVDIDSAVRGLADVAVPGRVEKIERGQDFLAVVDYAHKPAAVEAVLSTLSVQSGNARVAVVLGAGGDRDTEKRPLMGAAAARGADLVIVTDDNPRSEDPAVIRAAVSAGARGVPEPERRASDIREIGDRRAAIVAAVEWARSGDVVLVAGKGHESGQEIDGVKHPFDDREVLGEALMGDGEALNVLVAPGGADVGVARRLLREMVALAADSGAGSAHRATPHRTWAVFGELADTRGATENARAVEHDGLGRQAVRVAVDKIIAVGGSRVVRALHQGAVMEGSWGDEAAFVETPEAAVEHMRSAPGYAPGPGDVVVIAGPEGLASTLIDYWRSGVGLRVRLVDV